jgi:hypothetical protein
LRGTILIQATDCHWYPASNVVVQADPADAGSFGYFVSTVLTPGATATDTSGYAVLLNAPTDPTFAVSVTPLAVGHPTSNLSLFARPETASLMVAHP